MGQERHYERYGSREVTVRGLLSKTKCGGKDSDTEKHLPNGPLGSSSIFTCFIRVHPAKQDQQNIRVISFPTNNLTRFQEAIENTILH